MSYISNRNLIWIFSPGDIDLLLIYSRLRLPETLRLMERPLLRLRLNESFLIGDSERPRDDLLTERDLDLDKERRRSREWLRERRRSRSRDPRPPLNKSENVNVCFFNYKRRLLTVCDHDHHLVDHLDHRDEFAETLDVRNVPFELSIPCRQACDRP